MTEHSNYRVFCDHCGAENFTTSEESAHNVWWCPECMTNDRELLNSANLKDIYGETISYRSSFWMYWRNWGEKENIAKVRTIPKKNAKKTAECDHCGKPTNSPNPPNSVSWCEECIQQDYDLLNKTLGWGNYDSNHNYDTWWSNDDSSSCSILNKSADKIRTIPKKVIYCEPTVRAWVKTSIAVMKMICPHCNYINDQLTETCWNCGQTNGYPSN